MATNTDGREEIKPVAPTEQTKWRDPSLVGKYMVDPKTGLAGLFRSPDNGETWVLTDTVYGHVYSQDEVDNIWDNGAGHKVADEIKSATADLPNVRKQADEAVKFAESAIAASKVNSDAIVAQSSAVVEAKSAMDSATAEIQQLKANAASDVAQIRADVAQVQNEVDAAKAANSASVDKLKSDIGLAQKDLDNVRDSLTKAQSAVEQNQKLINDSVTKINSDIAQSRQDIVTAQQANDDLAKQLDTYSKEAQEQGKTIKTIQDNQDGFSITIADVKGDVTKVSDTVDGLSAGLKDAQGNIASVKAQADQLNATLTDHSKDIAQLTATAKELSSTLEDADGRLSKIEQTASEQSTTLSDLQGNLTQVKQTADNLVTTLKDAQGNIDQIKQDAKGTLEQLSNAQGDITALQKDVSGIKLTIADHDKNIHTLQVDSKTLKDDMADAKGNISSLQKTSTSLVSEFRDHDGRLSKVEQTATEHTSELADTKGNLDSLKQRADSLQVLLGTAQQDINNIKINASGLDAKLTTQGNDINQIKTNAAGMSTRLSGVETVGNQLRDQLNGLKIGTSNLLHNTSDQYRTLTNDGAWLQKTTASSTLTSVANYHGGDEFTYAATVTNTSNQPVLLEFQNCGQDRRWLTGKHSLPVPAGAKDYRIAVNMPITTDTWFLQTWLIFQDGKGAPGEKIQVKDERLVAGNVAGSWSPNSDDVADKITTNTVEINATKKMVEVKADKSEVDNVKGTVNQVSAEQKTMADQINQKVSSVEYQTLKDKVNNLRIGGRNLIPNSGTDIVIESKATDAWPAWCNRVIYWDLTPGETYTFSVSATNTNSVQEASVRIWNSASNKEVRNANFYFPADGKRHSKTFTVPDDGTSYSVWLYAGHMGKIEGKNFTTTYHHPQLELGNIESDYSPNPDDTITFIQKNATAIDENSKLISLMAKQTEVDNVKNAAQQISSRLDILAGEVKSKVDETRVNNIVDGKGYATTSTVQSLVDQKAGTLNESITKLDSKIDESGGGINLQGGTADCSLPIASNGPRITIENYDDHTKMIHAVGSKSGFYIGYDKGRFIPEVGETYTFSADIKGKGTINGNLFKYEGADKSSMGSITLNNNWQRIKTTVHVSQLSGTWIIYPNPDNGNNDFYVKNIKIERGSIATPYSQAPSDNATVTQFQSVTASIDGLQSNVTNYQNDTTSKYTQLSNLMQSKVSASDFNDLKDKTLWKSTDSIDLNTAVLQQKIFVKGGSNLPPGNYWWYVQVEPGYDSRIVQYAVSDRDNIHYSRQYDGSKWSAWSQGATESEITQLRDDINLRVKSGDLLSQINLTAGNTLIQSNKLYLDASSVVFSGRAFIPSAAIASLSADKVNTGWLNTNNVSLGDGRTRIRADHDYMYIQPTGSAASNTGIRMGYSGLDFLTNVIPNGYSSSVPYYSVGYDGASNGYLRISAFDHINSGGATATQNWYTMVDAISLNNQEINFAAKGNMHMQVVDGGVNIKPTLFFQNNTNNGTYTGFTRLDNSDTVEFNTGNNDGENFHVNSVARFMKYVYFNDYCRAQGWLTYSTLSKKTNIKKLDTSLALDKIRQDDQYLYEYKRNVAKGVYDPQASFIIDDVNDVSHYSVPREFIDQTGKYREPSVELSYLIAAFQEIDKQVQKQKEEIKELKEKLQHE